MARRSPRPAVPPTPPVDALAPDPSGPSPGAEGPPSETPATALVPDLSPAAGCAEGIGPSPAAGAVAPEQAKAQERGDAEAVGAEAEAPLPAGGGTVPMPFLSEAESEPVGTEASAVPSTASGALELKWVLESLLFAAQKPMTPKELRDLLVLAAQDEDAPEAAVFRKVRESDVLAALGLLQAEHEAAGRTYRLQCVADTWQFASVPRYAPWLRALLGRKARPPRLSQPGIETLTIIAYRQPVTRAEIEQIRGVSVDGVMQTLLERGLVEAVGRAEVIGRPVTYGTTPLFLEYFGLRSLEDLPAAEELRRLPVEKPEALATVDPGLATAPADVPPPVVELAEAEAPAAGSGASPASELPEAAAGDETDSPPMGG